MKRVLPQSDRALNLDSALAELARERTRCEVLRAQIDHRYDPIAGELAGECVMYATDREGILTYVSPSVERLFGHSTASLVGVNWREFAYQGTRSYAIAEEEERELLSGSESPARLITMRKADGNSVVLEVMSRPLCNADGEIIGIEGVCRETRMLDPEEVELRLTRDELEREVQRRTAELQYRLAFEELLVSLSTGFINLPFEQLDEGLGDALRRIGEFTCVDRCFIYQLDPSGDTASLTHEWCSPGAPSIRSHMQGVPIAGFEWEIGELTQGNALTFEDTSRLPPEATGIGPFYERLGIRSALNVPMLGHGVLQGMLGLSLIRGPRDWQEDSVSLVEVLAEVLVNALERHKAKAALIESEARLRLTIEGVEEGVYDWSIMDGTVVVSDYWLRGFGLPPGNNQRSESDWRDRIHPDDWPRAQHILKQHFAGKSPVFEAEYRMRHEDGHYRWNLTRGRVIQRTESGRPLRMVGVDRDITDAIQERERRDVLQEQIAHLGRITAMGETVAGIAHEVNQPLHAAATFNAASRNAMRSGHADKADSLSHKASEQISRAGDIIHRLREFTRPRPTEIVKVELNQLLRETAEFVMGHNRGSRVAISYDLTGEDLAVLGDPIQYQQVLVNLLQNAVDSIVSTDTDQGRIIIESRIEQDAAVVRVEDNGAGAEVEDPDELFSAFFSTKKEGMGIGLSLCRTILQSSNGRITATNNDHGGMTFTVRLPLN